METSKKILSASQSPGQIPRGNEAHNSFQLLEKAQADTDTVLKELGSQLSGLTAVEADWLTKPRKWAIGDIQRFILFIGPISSIFDYATFFIMLYAFNCWKNPALFHTGWFVESPFTQTLIIHVIHTNNIPFVESWVSWPLIFTSLILVSVGAGLTVSPLANTLGFVPLPPFYWLLLATMLLCYVTLTQVVRTWFIHRFPE